MQAVFLETGGNGTEVGVGEGAVRTELGAAEGAPAVDAEPGEFVNVVVEETTEAVLHSEWGMSLFDTVTDCGACCGVYPSSRCTNAVIG